MRRKTLGFLLIQAFLYARKSIAIFRDFSILPDLVCTNIKALPLLKGVYILDKQLISRLVGEFVKRFSIYHAGYNTLKKEFY